MTRYGLEYADDQKLIEELLKSIRQPGDFCTHGRELTPMPIIEVEGVGALSFPVPVTQIRELVNASERAPYGKGSETLLDASVRDCRQIDSSRIRIAGGAWVETFATLLERVSDGLGCPTGRLQAHLYKLLVYETGGFFVPHRDTEKASGMVATLTLSLPTAGAGGELVVRHRNRETRIDMNAAEPSELAYAAFYADCSHEVEPVREGHRLSLVFNLCLQEGDVDAAPGAPDRSAHVEALASAIAAWKNEKAPASKLVWLLEHDYSVAGLSFDALKNADDAVSRTLGEAAERSGCELHAAVVHVEEAGSVDYSDFGFYGDWYEEPAAEELRMEEVFDGDYWLDGWVRRDGGRPGFGKVPLNERELLPGGALEDAEPDEQRINEATGNEGITLERAYRRAALVLWPRADALDVLADASMKAAAVWLKELHVRHESSVPTAVEKLIELWPNDPGGKQGPARAMLCRLFAEVGEASPATRFLEEVVLEHYDGTENEHLPAALAVSGPAWAGSFLKDLVQSRFPSRPQPLLELLLRINATPGLLEDGMLRESARGTLAGLPDVFAGMPRRVSRASPEGPLGKSATRDLFLLGWRCGLRPEMEAAAVWLGENAPEAFALRTIPEVLEDLSSEPGRMDSYAAYDALWRAAADALLNRSARPPDEPRDWVISANLSCDCEFCAKLKTFCRDPAEQVLRLPLRKDLRKHLHQRIKAARLDMTHVTERRGSPFTLVCTKNRASHKRRLAEYAEDVARMSSLVRLAPGAESAEGHLDRLQGAIDAAG